MKLHYNISDSHEIVESEEHAALLPLLIELDKALQESYFGETGWEAFIWRFHIKAKPGPSKNLYKLRVSITSSTSVSTMALTYLYLRRHIAYKDKSMTQLAHRPMEHPLTRALSVLLAELYSKTQQLFHPSSHLVLFHTLLCQDERRKKTIMSRTVCEFQRGKTCE